MICEAEVIEFLCSFLKNHQQTVEKNKCFAVCRKKPADLTMFLVYNHQAAKWSRFEEEKLQNRRFG
jgi:hypothetical protein